jgi:hypothetical protein
MKCDDFLHALETGGWIQRFRARRHAANCPKCAAAQANLAEFKAQLSAVQPLSPRQCQLWKLSAPRPSPEPLAVGPLAPWLKFAACLAFICAALPFILWTIHRLHLPGDRQPTEGTVVIAGNPVEELTRLAADIDRLDADLDKLQQQAERIDARRQVAMTLDRFARW